MRADSSPDAGYQRLSRRRWLWWSGVAVVAGATAAGLSLRYWLPKATGGDATEAMDVCVVSPAIAYDPASGLPKEAPRPVPADARCPVCGMFPARTPKWAAQVLYRDARAHFFDSPVDMLVFLANVPGFSREHAREDVLSTWVADAGTGAWVAAEQAWYLHGSDALGPMRTGDLAAFSTREAAQRVAGQRGGKVLAYGEITPAIIKSLSGTRSHAMHKHD